MISSMSNIFINDIFLDLKNLNKFSAFLNTIEDDNLILTVYDNYIMYTSPITKLKMYMMDLSAVIMPKISHEALKKINFDVRFEMPEDVSKDLDKKALFVDNSDKLYIKYTNGEIFGVFSDETLDNVDAIAFKICDYDGDSFKPIILLYKYMRTKIPFKKQGIHFNYSTSTGLLKIDAKKYNSTISYFVPEAVK